MFRVNAFSAVVFAGILVLASTADAQAPSRVRPNRYYPPSGRPTVSPYLNLYRPNFGVAPNYHTLVRPQLQQFQYNQMLSREMRQQAFAIEAVEEQTDEMLLQMRTRARTPTGIRGGFMNYSHYYQFQPAQIGPVAPVR